MGVAVEDQSKVGEKEKETRVWVFEILGWRLEDPIWIFQREEVMACRMQTVEIWISIVVKIPLRWIEKIRIRTFKLTMKAKVTQLESKLICGTTLKGSG